jgi:F0F1-type ATP synthase assembly protein I
MNGLNQLPDDRSRHAVAYDWASRIISVSLGMALPGLLGFWLDTKLGTKPAFVVIGSALGLVVGIKNLLDMTRTKSGKQGS